MPVLVDSTKPLNLQFNEYLSLYMYVGIHEFTYPRT